MAERKDQNTFRRKVRILDLLPDEARSRLTVAELHAKLKDEGYSIARRGVERDLIELSRTLPLRASPGKPAGWSWLPHAKPPPLLGMDVETALAHHLMERFLQPLLPNPLLDGMRQQFEEANRVLHNQPRAKMAVWLKRVAVVPAGQPLLLPQVDGKVMRVVNEALLESKRFEADYRPMGGGVRERKRYRINPLGLVYRGGAAYLVATLWDYANLLQLSLQRMSNVELLDEPAASPKDFDLERYVRDERALDIRRERNAKLELRTSPWFTEYLRECRLSEDQAIAAIRGDERSRVTATVPATEQLVWWLLSFGSNVEVMKPKWLRDALAESVAAMAKCYCPRPRTNRARESLR